MKTKYFLGLPGGAIKDSMFFFKSFPYPQGILFQGLVGSGGQWRSANINSRQPLDGAAGRQYTRTFFINPIFVVFRVLHIYVPYYSDILYLY